MSLSAVSCLSAMCHGLSAGHHANKQLSNPCFAVILINAIETDVVHNWSRDEYREEKWLVMRHLRINSKTKYKNTTIWV